MTATTPPPHPVFPGEVRQVGHIVANIDAAMGEWLAVGVGPWTVIEVTQHAEYLGERAKSSISIGFAHAGAMQIELIEAHGDAHSSWHEARDAGRFGPHHLAYWTDDFERSLEQVARTELSTVVVGDGNGMARFVYLAGAASGMMIEIMELTELSRPFMEGIRDLSEHWDGSGPPVRR